MKYEFLLKKNLEDISDEKSNNDIKIFDDSFVSSTNLSTNKDYNIFIKKTTDKNKIDDNDNHNNKIKDSEKNSLLFESEKKTVDTIVEYSSKFIDFLFKVIYIIKNTFLNLILKKKK